MNGQMPEIYDAIGSQQAISTFQEGVTSYNMTFNWNEFSSQSHSYIP